MNDKLLEAIMENQHHFSLDNFLSDILDILGISEKQIDMMTRLELRRILKKYEDLSDDDRQDALDSAYAEGKEQGYDEGHDDGYDEGWNDAIESQAEED